MQQHSIEMDAAGRTLVDGAPEDFGAAVQRFAAEAAASGAPVLVSNTAPGSGTSWFHVDAAGQMSAVPTAAPVVRPAPVSVPAENVAGAPGLTPAASTHPMAAEPQPVRRENVVAAPASVSAPVLSVDTAAPEAPRLRRTAADFTASQAEPATQPAEEGFRGTLNRLSGGALRLQAGPAEVARREARASVHRGLAGSRTITVANLKGGGAKTTVTYLLGATLGRVRGGNILAWDNNENKGTLGDRAQRAGHDHTAVDVLEHIERFRSPATAHEIANFVRRQGESKFDVLASQNVASDREVIDGEAFAEIHGVLRQFYQLLIVDTGNASTAGTWQAAMELADTIVLTAMNKEDSLKTAMATIDVLVESGYSNKLSRSVLLVTQPAIAGQGRRAAITNQSARLQRTREHAESFGIRVVEIPFDPALDDGGNIVYEALLPQTQEAYLKATALIVDGL